MRLLPRRLAASLERRRYPVRTVTVDLAVDLSGFQAAMAQLQESNRRMVLQAQRAMAQMGPAMEAAARLAVAYSQKLAQARDQRREVMLSGLEARYYVQGSFTPDAVDVCRSIRRAQFQMDLTDGEVIRLQVAAMAGAAGAWAPGADEPAPAPECDGVCIMGYEVAPDVPADSVYAVDPACSLHGSIGLRPWRLVR